MSDVKGIEISDVLGLSEPLTKLIESVRCGIGKAYEPAYIKRMAKAKAEEIRTISGAMNDNINLPMSYSKGDVTIDATEAKELMQRTGNRLLFQEMQKQQNIESVIANAYTELEGETVVSDEAIDKDWILRFFNSVEDVSNDKMQQIWGKILAGEVKQPKTYSLRTLEKVKNITQYEVKLFQKISEFVILNGTNYFIFENDDILNKHGCYFKDLLDLDECGLMTVHEVTVKITLAKDKPSIIRNRKIVGLFLSEQEESQTVKFSIYPLTEAGIQLYNTINFESNKQYAIDNLLLIKQEAINYTVSAHSIDNINSNQINYSLVDLLL